MSYASFPPKRESLFQLYKANPEKCASISCLSQPQLYMPATGTGLAPKFSILPFSQPRNLEFDQKFCLKSSSWKVAISGGKTSWCEITISFIIFVISKGQLKNSAYDVCWKLCSKCNFWDNNCQSLAILRVLFFFFSLCPFFGPRWRKKHKAVLFLILLTS